MPPPLSPTTPTTPGHLPAPFPPPQVPPSPAPSPASPRIPSQARSPPSASPSSPQAPQPVVSPPPLYLPSPRTPRSPQAPPPSPHPNPLSFSSAEPPTPVRHRRPISPPPTLPPSPSLTAPRTPTTPLPTEPSLRPNPQPLGVAAASPPDQDLPSPSPRPQASDSPPSPLQPSYSPTATPSPVLPSPNLPPLPSSHSPVSSPHGPHTPLSPQARGLSPSSPPPVHVDPQGPHGNPDMAPSPPPLNPTPPAGSTHVQPTATAPFPPSPPPMPNPAALSPSDPSTPSTSAATHASSPHTPPPLTPPALHPPSLKATHIPPSKIPPMPALISGPSPSQPSSQHQAPTGADSKLQSPWSPAPIAPHAPAPALPQFPTFPAFWAVRVRSPPFAPSPHPRPPARPPNPGSPSNDPAEQQPSAPALITEPPPSTPSRSVQPPSPNTASASPTTVVHPPFNPDQTSDTVEVTFHGVAYLLSVTTTNGDTLTLEIEQKSDCSRWRADFTSRYIEDITSKTGNFKKFLVFVKMLLSAVTQASESVFVDLLTYQDLEALKSRKEGGAQTGGARTIPPNNKRYLILTYAAEFDRVHYPLPLLYEENPDPQRLKQVIRELRVELDTLSASAAAASSSNGRGHDAPAAAGAVGLYTRKGGPAAGPALDGELRRVLEDNAALLQRLKHTERALAASNGGGGGDERSGELARELKLVRKERDMLAARLDGVDAELERERGLHRRELRRKAKEAQESMEERQQCHDTIRELKLRVRQLTDELDGSYRRGNSADRMSGPTYMEQLPSVQNRSSSRAYDSSSRDRSRPNSAPVKPRFDPTQYVRARQEKELALQSNTRRPRGSTTPPLSHASSHRSSPTASRPGSAERDPNGSSGSRRGLSPLTSSRQPSHSSDPHQQYPSHQRPGPTSASASGYRGSRAPPLQDPFSQPRSRSGSAGAGGRDSPTGSVGSGSSRIQRPPPAGNPHQRHSPWDDSGSASSSTTASRTQHTSSHTTNNHTSGLHGNHSLNNRNHNTGSSSNGGGGGSGAAWSKFPVLTAGNGGGPGRQLQALVPNIGSAYSPRLQDGGGGGVGGGGGGGERASSPGRALQEVKRKLSEYVSRRPGQGPPLGLATSQDPDERASLASLPDQPAAASAAIFDDASGEIADIDSRLHALQNFLKMAKSSSIANSASTSQSAHHHAS
ncbi:MAG: hypothetical protein WDW36_000449 [Sanguina aurantia]